MQTFPARFRHILLLLLIWNVFLPWYLLERPLGIVKGYIAYARVWAEIFSFKFLLLTLFSPWKHLTEEYPANSLALGRVLYVFSVNSVARCVGLTVRLITLCIGLIVQMILFAIALMYLVVWYAFPLFVVAGLQYIVFRLLW